MHTDLYLHNIILITLCIHLRHYTIFLHKVSIKIDKIWAFLLIFLLCYYKLEWVIMIISLAVDVNVCLFSVLILINIILSIQLTYWDPNKWKTCMSWTLNKVNELLKVQNISQHLPSRTLTRWKASTLNIHQKGIASKVYSSYAHFMSSLNFPCSY